MIMLPLRRQFIYCGQYFRPYFIAFECFSLEYVTCFSDPYRRDRERETEIETETERQRERQRERERERESMLHTRVIRIALAVFKPGCSST